MKAQLINSIVNEIINLNNRQFDRVRISPIHEYPVIGIGSWSLDDADYLLDQIPNGISFIDLPYQLVIDKGIVQLKRILASEQGQKEQIKFLTSQVQQIITYLEPHNISEKIQIYIIMWSIINNISIHRLLNLCNNDIETISKQLIDNYSLYTDGLTAKKNKSKIRELNIKIINYINSL